MHRTNQTYNMTSTASSLSIVASGQEEKKDRLFYILGLDDFVHSGDIINRHETKGNKIVIFVDNEFAATTYALGIHKPYIFNGTNNDERKELLEHFATDSKFNCLFISAAGSSKGLYDLPCADVVFEVYVNGDTAEAQHPRFLVDRGHTFKVVTAIDDPVQSEHSARLKDITNAFKPYSDELKLSAAKYKEE